MGSKKRQQNCPAEEEQVTDPSTTGDEVPPEFRGMVDEGLVSLGQSTEEAFAEFGLGSWQRWDLNQRDGGIVFSNPGIGPESLRAECPAQLLGSFCYRTSSWKWAWSNPSLNPDLTSLSKLMKAYGKKKNIPMLTEEAAFPIPPEVGDRFGREMTAAAFVMLKKIPGNADKKYFAYGAPTGTVRMFCLCDFPTFTPEEQKIVDELVISGKAKEEEDKRQREASQAGPPVFSFAPFGAGGSPPEGTSYRNGVLTKVKHVKVDAKGRPISGSSSGAPSLGGGDDEEGEGDRMWRRIAWTRSGKRKYRIF